MTKTQLLAVKDKIVTELEKTAHNIEQLEEVSRQAETDDRDEITRMESLASKSVHETTLASARKRLAGLEYALKRVEHPDFGYCVECGEEIPFARLLAMPQSSLCIDCAS